MKKIFHKMMRDQVQEDLNHPEELINKPVPKGGWLQVIRTVLGLTGKQLAHRLGISSANIPGFERREREGSISLKKLAEIAEAMDCRLVYFLVPNKPFDKLLEERARMVAKKRLRTVGHSMALESQGLSRAQTEQQEKELIEELLQGNLKDLWDEEL